MIRTSTRTYIFRIHLLLGVLGLWLLPLLSWAQTTITNYDFNSATTPLSPVATALGVTSAASASKTSTPGSGAPSGPGAYAANAAGSALTMNSLSATSTEYFQFTLDGASLPKYSSFKLYVQGFRSPAGPTALTLQYSLDGTAYTSYGNALTPGNPSFNEANFDLSSLTTLNAPARLFFRLAASGSTGGNVRIDNFQVQAVNTVDPVVSTLAPNAIEAGSPGFALSVGGSNFTSGAVVSFNGQALATTYNSPTSLTATVPAAAISAAGSYNVTVANPAAGSTTSLPTTFTVTPALLRWTGGGNSASWFNPANWSTNVVPGANDDVLLDHRVITSSYTVSFDQNTTVSIKSLTVNPGVGDSIFVVVPATNTMTPAALALTNTGTGAVALAIYPKGVVTNASGAGSGDGIVVPNSGLTVFIYNGGSYRHATVRSHADVVDNLSTAVGTEQGIFDFRLPSAGTRSYTVSVANRTYGTLILRNSPGGAPISYPAGSANSLTIRGDLLVGPGVTFTPTVGGDMRVNGDIRVQGTMQVSSSTSATSVNQVVLAGAKPQTISGNIALLAGVGLVVSNSAGMTLASPLLLNGNLTLNSGTLTTTATNLLTLASTSNPSGGSSISFINGPLARQTAAGALSNLAFPVGTGATYRPVLLNATAQDATTYLVTAKQGVAPDPNNFLAGTTTLPTLTRVSHNFFYTITSSAPNNFNGTITLPYGTNDNVNQPNDASFTIGKNSNGAGWQNIGNGGVNVATPATATTGATGTITSQTFTSFSNFALASTSADATINPLPVTLTSFAAVRQASGAVQVRWATASEQHSARFEVQRSTDAVTFATIAMEATHGTTNQAQTYFSTDGAATPCKLYYRLKEVDTDGSVQYSPVVALASTAAAATQMLYPNPTHDRLVVPAAAGQQVQVLDLLGHQLQNVFLPPSGEVSVQELPAGTYLLRVFLDGRWQAFRFTKQ